MVKMEKKFDSGARQFYHDFIKSQDIRYDTNC